MGVCKICLCSNPETDISQLKSTEYEDQSGEYILLFCLGIQVTQDSRNNTKFCETCFKKLMSFHQFKCLALKNEAILSSLGLQKYLENEIKSEILSQTSDDNIYDEPLIDYALIQEEQPLEEISTNITEQSINIPLKQEFFENEHLGKKKNIRKTSAKREKSNESKLFSCNICGKQLKTKSTLEAHQATHEPIEQRKARECAHCTKTFLRKHSLELHIIKEHPEEVSEAAQSSIKKYQCYICTKIYLQSRNLHDHIAKVHKGKPQCPICKKHFAEKYLQTHIKTKHKEQQTQEFKCDTCGKCFAGKSVLRNHLSVHTGEKPHACDICGAKFRLKYSVGLHKAQVHEKSKNHVCHICSKRYFTGSLLQRHIRKHSKPVSSAAAARAGAVKRVIVKEVECPDCGKPLASRRSLRVHRLLHDAQRSTCNVCGLTFATRSYVLNHMKTHRQERKFVCKYCEATFIRSSARRRHELEIHMGEKKPRKKAARKNRKKKPKEDEEAHGPNLPTVIVSVPGQSDFDPNRSIFPISGSFKNEEEMLQYK